MSFSLDSYFGIHAKALTIREQRTSVLASNLAHINTPNYKAKDIDFNAALTSAMQGSSQQITVSSPNHINGESHFNNSLKFRTPNHTSLDGNTVDKDMETTIFAENSVGYQASLSFLDNKIKSMMTVLRGE